MEDSHSDQDERRSRRDWLLALLLLLLGLLCLCVTAELAIRPAQTWQASANMRSDVNPDTGEVVKVEPVGPKALTPLPLDKILTPEGTPSPVPQAIIGQLPTATSTRQAAIVPTSTATDTPIPPPPDTATFTPPPTGTFTPSPTDTPTSTPTGSPTPTFTPLPTLTFTPVPAPTNTSEPPTDTPTPGPTDTPTPTPTDTPTPTPTDTPTPTPTPTDTPTPTNTPIPPPIVLSITPNQGLNTAPVPVVIGGENFMDPPSVYLGSNSLINTWVDAYTINATVPAGLAPGVYALTVTNPDSQFDTLPAAYTVLAPSDPLTTLENAQLLTAGSTLPGHGDDDHVQVIFFEIPTGYGGGNDVYFRIYDADTGGGGGGELIDQRWTFPWDTSMRYTLRGGDDAYTQAQAAHPTPGQITSGTQLAQIVIGADNTYHDNWNLVFGPYTADQGEARPTGWVFKLVVEGMGGDDGNGYQAAVSINPGDNTAPAGSRVFAYCWTFTFDPSGAQPPFYPHLPAGTTSFTQYNLDFDDDGSGSMTLHTPLQDITLLPPSDVSTASGETRSSSHPVSAGEDGVTWTVELDINNPYSRNNGSFWTTGDGVDLAIFTQPTTSPAP
jgi:hypothetical protein